jgi:PPK2 family polyphosphate:nucleotide phosphotransferase
VAHSFGRLRLPPGAPLELTERSASTTPGWTGGRGRAEAALVRLREELDRLQELFYADGRHGLLVVLQGMDTSGKDGVIRHVFQGVNPQGVQVSSFKPPTPRERSHDFLWRIHPRVPPKGEIAIFNRSHYEDVLVARVDRLVPKARWSDRYRAINAFERELGDEGTTVLKFFLHVSRDEQRRRLLDRLHDPSKQWKLSPSDLHAGEEWSEYRTAHEEMLSRTSTRWAPWYVLPADHKWYRNLAVSSLLVEALRSARPNYPPPSVDLATVKIT